MKHGHQGLGVEKPPGAAHAPVRSSHAFVRVQSLSWQACFRDLLQSSVRDLAPHLIRLSPTRARLGRQSGSRTILQSTLHAPVCSAGVLQSLSNLQECWSTPVQTREAAAIFSHCIDATCLQCHQHGHSMRNTFRGTNMATRLSGSGSPCLCTFSQLSIPG